MTFRRQTQFGSKQPSKVSQHAAMLTYLATARSLDGVTAETLAHRHRVTVKVAEYELVMARQRRAANG